jgi:hypothetical protein
MVGKYLANRQGFQGAGMLPGRSTGPSIEFQVRMKTSLRGVRCYLELINPRCTESMCSIEHP